jgi:hypothetical protein
MFDEPQMLRRLDQQESPSLLQTEASGQAGE